MTPKIKVALAALTAAVAVALVLAFTLADGTAKTARHHALAARAAALFTPAQAAKTCSALTAAPIPLAAYDQAVISEVTALSRHGNATRAQSRQALAAVAGEVRSDCPQFRALIAQEGSG